MARRAQATGAADWRTGVRGQKGRFMPEYHEMGELARLDRTDLFLVDGSVFVTSGGVNPTSTIVAIALRAADHMVETRFEQQVPV